jgi:hypothetical protein
MTRIDADFNMIDEHGLIWLPDAEKANVHRGERVMLSDGDVQVEATLEYDAGRHIWLGAPDRDTIRTVAEVPAPQRV